jgi:hypothetical protein
LGQTISVSGRIVNEQTGESIPFVNIVLKGTKMGLVSDSAGKFKFQIPSGRKRDTLLIAAIGFEKQMFPVSPLEAQFINVELIPVAFNLREAVIRPGENPAFRIIRKVIANKANFDPENKLAYEYEAFHKVEFDMNNFTEKTKRNIFLRSFSFVFENADTTADGVNYLPILLTESHSQVYYQKNPTVQKELILGRRSVGLKGPKIMKFAEDMYISPDIYREYIVILDKNFPSPINDNFKSHYRYYLIDSLLFHGKRCYYIQFKPKQKEAIAFSGEMYVEDSSFVVRQVTLEFSITANVNFVRNYWIRQDYENVDSQHSMLTKSRVVGDFTVMENSTEMTGFFGKKTSEYRNYKINLPKEENFYKKLDRITFDDSATFRSENYWNKTRQSELSKDERSIVYMIDTLEKQRKYHLLKNSVKSITSGWIPIKKIEIGDFYTFYSYNKLEKSRVKIGLRAQHLFQNKLSFKSYLAYGTFDEGFKYLAQATYVLSRQRARENRIGGKIKKDVVQLGRSSNIFPLDHVLNSYTNLSSFRDRNLVNELDFFLERQWMLGFTTRVTLFQNTWNTFGGKDFRHKLSDQIKYSVSSYVYSGLQFSARFSLGERNLTAVFGDGIRGHAFPKFPVLSLKYEKAFEGFNKGEFSCDKLKIRIEHKARIAKYGFSLLRVEGGKTWGVLPFPFLETPLANPIFFNDETAFNMMNYLEFVSDQYASVMLEHHFEGLLFSRIPGIKKLKWRELILAKMYLGNLSNQNRNSNFVLADGMSILNEPYIEVGFGIENIFKFSRVDFLWRLTYRDKTGNYNFIAKPMVQFKF